MRYSHDADVDLLNPFEGLGQLVDFPGDFGEGDDADEHGFEGLASIANTRELFELDLGHEARLA